MALRFDHFGDHSWDVEAKLSMWEAVTAPFFSFSPAAPIAMGFQAEASVIALQDIMLAHTSASAQSFHREAKRSGEPEWNHIVVQLYLRGGYVGQMAGQDVRVRPGDICILDLTMPLDTRAEPFENITIAIPRDLAYAHQSALYHGRVIPAETGTAQILATHMRAMSQNAGALSGAEFNACAQAILALISGHKDPAYEQTRPAVKAALKAQIVEHIDFCIGQQALSPNDIARRFGLSRASLYRLFEREGGVRSIIKRRSLDRAKHLMRSAGPSTTLEEISIAAGFATPAHFSRSFRTAFAMSPKEFCNTLRAPAGSGGRAGTVEACVWFDTLVEARQGVSTLGIT